MAHSTRESWLMEAAAALVSGVLKEADVIEIAPHRVSVGFPKANGKAIGQVWDIKASKGEIHEIFICPTRDDPIEVLGILLHELIHVAVGLEHGHKGPFRTLAKRVGLTGKMTATVVPDDGPLHNALAELKELLGTYPHQAMAKPSSKGSSKRDYVRCVSTTDETYKVYVSLKLFDEHGAPMDPWGELMEPVL